MATPLLEASPEIVVVASAMTTAATEIHYVSRGGQPFVWERFGLGSWSKVTLEDRVTRSDSGDPDIDGYFSATMTAGAFYQVRLYDDFLIDPNLDDPSESESRALATLMVPALLETGRGTLIVSRDQSPGGTNYAQKVLTNVPTNCFLRIGNSEPVPDIHGNLRFSEQLLAKLDFLNQSHNLQLEPLLPGNDFWALGLVFDKAGRYDTFVHPFRTLIRKVTINFNELHVINDGALGDTTAEFNIWVREGNETIAHYFFGAIDNFPISDRPDPGHETEEHIPLPQQGVSPVIIGPKRVTPDNHDIGILIRGLARHKIESNEPCANYFPASQFPDDTPHVRTPNDARFGFPTGSAESVSNATFVVRARPEITGNEFEFDVWSLVTVEYL
jgi:hypothetical protein